MTDPNTSFILTYVELTYPYEFLYFILNQFFDFPTISTSVPLTNFPNFLEFFDGLLLTSDLYVTVPKAIAFLRVVFAFSSSEKSP